MMLVFWTEFVSTKKVQIFQKRYCGSLQVKSMQSYQLSKLEVSRKSLSLQPLAFSLQPLTNSSLIFFSHSRNLGLKPFSLVTSLNACSRFFRPLGTLCTLFPLLQITIRKLLKVSHYFYNTPPTYPRKCQSTSPTPFFLVQVNHSCM